MLYICILSTLLFALHQLQLYVRYDPINSNMVRAHQGFREQSFIQFMCFACLIGAFLSLKYYVPLICVIYSGAFWGVYLNSNQCLMDPLEATLSFSSHLFFAGTTVYVLQFAVHDA